MKTKFRITFGTDSWEIEAKRDNYWNDVFWFGGEKMRFQTKAQAESVLRLLQEQEFIPTKEQLQSVH